jgi:transposase
MQDKELYRQILGIESPWRVEDVELDTDKREVLVWLANVQQELPCPECAERCPRHDVRHRRWRHLDTCQFQTTLCAQVPRIRCPEHGVRQVKVPWAEAGSGFTALFEALVISWLLEASVSAVARLLDLPWSSVAGIRRRAVQRGMARREAHLPKHLGVDETSFQKRHEYVTVLIDQETATVVHVADGRSRSVLDEFFDRFSLEERERVESVAMDMWQAYIASVKASIPDAERKIVFDKFHVAQHLCDAVDRVRREENRALSREGDDRLKKSRYLWLQNPASMSWQNRERLESLRSLSLRTARAWAIKEFAATLWRYRSRAWARKAWLRWYSWAIRSRLEPIKRVARMIKSHLEGIVNAVVSGVTNARAEGINSRIQWIKRTACGYRNRNHFREAIYFHLGGLDLFPEGVRSIHTT